MQGALRPGVFAGYNVCCPFLPSEVEVLKEDKPQLLLNVAHPHAPGIFFLGFVQAHGPMIPCVEGQMPWVADLIQVILLHTQLISLLCLRSTWPYLACGSELYRKNAPCPISQSIVLAKHLALLCMLT